MAYKDPIKQREFQRKWQANQRAKHKAKVLEMFGGGCILCGFDNILALHIDHVIAIKRPSHSDRGITTGTALWRKVASGRLPKSEVQLLCANCHAIKTYEELYKK